MPLSMIGEGETATITRVGGKEETRRFDDETGETFKMRDKADAVDYKYFIEPNIPPIKVTDELLDEIRKNIYGRRVDDKETEAFPMSVWIAIYRKALIDKNHLKFKNIISEDVIFNISAYKFADTMVFTGDTDYCYRNENQTSIMRSFSESKLKKYEDYLKVLMQEISKENDPDCLMRVKRAAINICRLYVGQVADTSLTIKEKKKFVKMFAKLQVVCNCWNGYPVDELPFQQRLFQKAVQSGYYGTALLLVDIRKISLESIDYESIRNGHNMPKKEERR